jgi:hypothetical protein
MKKQKPAKKSSEKNTEAKKLSKKDLGKISGGGVKFIKN